MRQLLNLVLQCNYGIEYIPENTTQNNAGGLNFWRPFGSSGGYKNFVMHIADSGNVGIGTGDPEATLHIQIDDNLAKSFVVSNSTTNEEMFIIWGNGVANCKYMFAQGIKIKPVSIGINTWPDYVFSTSYKLMPLNEVEQFIEQHNHLPDVPSQSQVFEQGIDIYEMNTILLQKIEELYLYVIELEKRIDELAK